MPIKETGAADDWREVDRFDGGVGWIAYPGEGMRRASHALATDGGVWLVDPVDHPDLDDQLAELGDVAGVAVLLNRHYRDAGGIARRHDASVWVPPWFDEVPDDLGAPVERLGDALPDASYEVLRVVDNRFWKEAALFDGETLVVPEAVGTLDYFAPGDRRLGVHPGLRIRPPRKTLGGLDPGRVLVGHGRGVEEGAGAALSEALRVARRTAPRAWTRMVLGTIRS